MGSLAEASYVTALGMGLVFLALGVVMLVAFGLDRIFRAKPETEPSELPAQVETLGLEVLEEEGRVAAVIAAAMVALEQESELEALSNLPESVLTLKRIPRGWKAAGRFAGLR